MNCVGHVSNFLSAILLPFTPFCVFSLHFISIFSYYFSISFSLHFSPIFLKFEYVLSAQIPIPRIQSLPQPAKDQFTTRKSFTRRELNDHFEDIVFGGLETGPTPVERLIEIGAYGYQRSGYGSGSRMSQNVFNGLTFPNNPNIKFVVRIDLRWIYESWFDAAMDGILHILEHYRVLRVSGTTPESLEMLFKYLDKS